MIHLEMAQYLEEISKIKGKSLQESGLSKDPTTAQYRCQEQFVLENGIWSTFVDSDILLGTPKECYSNALKRTIENPDKYIYVEGFIMPEKIPFPIHHAWLVDRGNHTKAYEVTLPPRLGAACGIGVLFNPGYVFSTAIRTGYAGVLDNIQDHWSLLRGLDLEKALWKE